MLFQSLRDLAFFTLAASAVLVTAEPIPAFSANPINLAARRLEKRNDCHGSSYCGSAGKQQIGNAITAMSASNEQGFLGENAGNVHKAYTSHAKKSSDGYGMTAMFVCNSDEDYANSQWTGQDIFEGMRKVYTDAYCGWCGTYWLDKFPLLQLVASFPRPPLSFKVETLVILHLLGDPIDTTRNLLRKLAACQQMAKFWRSECDVMLEAPTEEDKDHRFDLKDRNWKALTLVTDAYGEWQETDHATDVLHSALSSLKNAPEVQAKITEAVRITARALAADRSTKLLPIIVAEFLFIRAIAVAMGKTTSSAKNTASSDTVFVNVEAHSVAFSALYFWILPAVFMGALIGVSQTEDAIPRILRRFQIDLDRLLAPDKYKLSDAYLDGVQTNISRWYLLMAAIESPSKNFDFVNLGQKDFHP
ncbi:MAG: hypothetical protein Q9168_004384 [Polycauliona sp. 1 TL-2023]